MATDLTTVTDTEARMRVFQIIGSDITPDLEGTVWAGDWHKALQTTAARWTEQTPATPAA
jgi:hypothetical protein